MMTVLRRYQLREIHRAMIEENWHKKSVRALLMGTQGLLREVNFSDNSQCISEFACSYGE
jgi:hypothetical protein